MLRKKYEIKKNTIINNKNKNNMWDYISDYEYKGVKNKTEFTDFMNLCKMTQKELKEYLRNYFTLIGREVICEKGFLYIKGDIPVLLTAHLDTVHEESVKDFYEYIDENGNHILSSPQGIGGDDRCGVYAILGITAKRNVSILFCEDEEIGGAGALEFCESKYIDDLSKMKFLIELDRKGEDEAVFYECENKEFTDFILNETGFKKEYGSFSDISFLAPYSKIAAVNLSVGYYNAHTSREEVHVEKMLHSIDVIIDLIDASEKISEPFEYIESEYVYGYGYVTSPRYDSYDYYDAYDNHAVYIEIIYPKEIIFEDGYSDWEEVSAVYHGCSIEDCFGQFFIDHPNICYSDIIDYYFF